MFLQSNDNLHNLRLGLNLLGGLVAAVVALGSAWIIWGPLSRETAEASVCKDAYGDLLREEEYLRAERAKLGWQLDAARQQDIALRNRIPQEPREADFLAQVSRAAGELGLQITDYRPGVMTAKSSCSAMRVELNCEGTYRGICGLLGRLQELPRHSTVAKLEIDAGPSADKCLAKISLELYFFGKKNG
jgi:Tfp pilus assembly protein PilO